MAPDEPSAQAQVDSPVVDDQPVQSEPEEVIVPDDDWRTKARKHERKAKVLQAELEAAQSKLKETEDAAKTDAEKAIEEAQRAGFANAEAQFSAERKADRLAVAVAAHARELADVEDVILNLNAAITSGDIDAADIFDKSDAVNTGELAKALEDLLKRKPHLKAGPNGRPVGSGDAGKGADSSPDTGDFNAILRARAGKA